MGVELLSGPPGSGKKDRLNREIAAYISSGRDISRLLVLSNTKDSAMEFREFVLGAAGSVSELWVESVSSFCKKLLREYYYLTPLKPGFRVISDFEKRLIVRDVLRNCRALKYFSASRSSEGLARELSDFLDTAKRSPEWRKSAVASGSGKFGDLLTIYENYHRSLRRLNCCDFTDLTIYAGALLRDNPGVVDFESVYVYEAEDMDKVMGGIIEVLVERSSRAVISLNPSSGIYSFRGAEPFMLKKRLCSRFSIIETSASNIKKPSSGSFLEAETRGEQAQLTALHIASRIRSGHRPGEIAVIARSVGENMLPFTEALAGHGINAVITGGIGFFRQREIAELMSVLKCCYEGEKAEDLHVYRAMRFSGASSEDELDCARRDALLSGRPLIEELDSEFRSAFTQLTGEFVEGSDAGAPETIYAIMKKFGFFRRAASDIRASMLYGYFIKAVTDFAELSARLNSSGMTFPYFMDNIFDLLRGFGKDMDIPLDSRSEAVRIMTVQQAKGKKFRTVYLADMLEGTFPREFTENPLLSSGEHRILKLKPYPGIKNQLAFEKKLFSIASTRADEESVYCWYRVQDDSSPAEVSSFIDPEKLRPLEREMEETVICERDFLLKSAEFLSRESLLGISSELPADLAEKMRLLDRVRGFIPGEIHDTVSEGLPEVFSHSSLSNYSDCPAYFFLRNVLRTAEPETMHKLLGTAVHRILQVYHADGGDPSALIAEIWKECSFVSEFESRNLYLTARKIIDAYIKASKSEKFSVQDTEKSFSVELKDMKFSGRFDRVDDFMGYKRVVDYKTGKNEPAEKGLLNAVARGDNFQIPIYAKASGARFFTIYRLRHEPEKMLVTVDLNSEKASSALENAFLHITETVNNIREGRFTPEPGNSCRNCYFDRICSGSQ